MLDRQNKNLFVVDWRNYPGTQLNEKLASQNLNQIDGEIGTKSIIFKLTDHPIFILNV